MKIIDIHAHLGSCKVFDQSIGEEDLLRAMDENNIEAMIVQPFPGVSDARAVHDRIAKLGSRHPGRIFGMVSINPHIGREQYITEVERCIKDLRFVAIKLHTIGHAISPLSEDADIVFKTAERLKVPVMVHTGLGTPFSNPSLCIPKAKEYPNVPIILSHSGFCILAAEAYIAAKECQNIYLGSAWTPVVDLEFLIKGIGASRIMFESDFPINIPVELAKFKALKLSKEELQECLRAVAKKVFNL